MQACVLMPASQELCLPSIFLAGLKGGIPEVPHLCCAASMLVQGSLHCPEDFQMGERLAMLMGRCSRDARMYLRKWLREALRQAGIQPKIRIKAGMPTAKQIT